METSSNPQLNSWYGFLPPRATVMARTRSQIVIVEGNPQAKLLFVRESSEDPEDLQGQLLNRMIEAMGLRPQDVSIAKIFDPTQNFGPLLQQQIQALRPQVIVALGEFVAQALLNTTEGITQIRGSFQDYQGIKLMPTLHLSYLLLNPATKKDAWYDLQLVAKELGIQIPTSKNSNRS